MKPATAMKSTQGSLLWYQTKKLVCFHSRGGVRARHKPRAPLSLTCNLVSQGRFALSCVCRKMERKLPGGNIESKTTRRKEKCYSLAQEVCQVHLWIKQLCIDKVCHKLMWRGQRNLTSFLRIHEMKA